MYNTFLLVGRVVDIQKNYSSCEEENKDGIILTISNNYEEEYQSGKYTTILNRVYLYGSIAKNTLEYVSIGDIIGAKGQIKNDLLICNKVSFLQSHKEDGEKQKDTNKYEI